MANNILKGLLALLAIGAVFWVIQNFRRPYALETFALEIYCPDHQNDLQCLLYSRVGFIYAPYVPASTQIPQCTNPGWHFVGRNSDGAAQCCGPGFHWNGPDTGRCTKDASP